MSLRELVFPRQYGQPGTMFPGSPPGNQRLFDDFGGIESPTWPNPSYRLLYVLDPAGSGQTVLRWELDDGDLDTAQYGADGQRIEFWPSLFDHVPGSHACFAFSWFLGDGTKGDLFRVPSPGIWALMFQLFDVGGGSPPWALEISSAGRWLANARTAPSDEGPPGGARPTINQGGRADIGAAARGHWHNFLMGVDFARDTTGRSRIWHRADAWPSLDPATGEPGAAPDDERRIRTLYGGQGHPCLHMYRADGPPQDYPWVAYSRPFSRADTFAKVLANVGATGTSPPPPPLTNAQLRDQALAELELTTVGYRNVHWTTPPAGTHWRNALDLLAKIT